MDKFVYQELADQVVDLYGVASYQNNLNDDEEDEINNEVWFTCPECDEPLIYEDFCEEIKVLTDNLGIEYFLCPICGERIDLE